MISRRIRIEPSHADLIEGFARIRKQMSLPPDFPTDVLAEARRSSSSTQGAGSGSDIAFVTIDPEGSMDLDQAYHGSRLGGGYLIHYAIADVGSFIESRGPLDNESLERGKTFYCPDLRITLYPLIICEDAASLLPDKTRRAILWTFELDKSGVVVDTHVERALVKSVRKLSYVQAQGELDAGAASDSLKILREVGKLRQQLERKRGGVNLRIPTQEVTATKEGFELSYRTPLDVEEWNSQISLMTGMEAAKLMLSGGIGLLRTLPRPSPEILEKLHRSADALDVDWADGATYQEFIRSLSPGRPPEAAMMSMARSLFRGVGYTFFNGSIPKDVDHHAIAGPYAHVTAPLRRMADRLSNELILCFAKGSDPPQWLLDRLKDAPEAMRAADRRDQEIESRVVDFMEAEILKHRVGDVFDAVVVESGRKAGIVQLKDPAVLGPCQGESLPLGHRLDVKLIKADPISGTIRFEAAA